MTREDFERAWSEFKLDKAMAVAGETHDCLDVWAMICSGEAAYWAANRSAVVVEPFITPKVKAISIWLMGGDIYEIRDDIMPKIENWARGVGLDTVYGGGRPALLRIIGPMGYKTGHQVFYKDLR